MLRRFFALAVVLGSVTSLFGDQVTLSTGEVLHVTNVTRSGDTFEMDHPVLGHLKLTASQVSGVHTDTGAPVEPPAPPPPPVETPKWKFRAELGVNGQSGNTRTTDLRAAIGALLETPDNRTKLDAVYMKSRTNGEDTKQNSYFQGIHDWILSRSPWSVFATGRFDCDRFQNWDNRATVGAGVAYKWIETESVTSRLRAGLAATREWGSDDESWRPEGLLGAEVNWKISESQSFEATATYYPDLEETNEYRAVLTAGWSVKLSTDGLSLKVGVEDEIDSHRESPFKKSDLKYFAALLYEF